MQVIPTMSSEAVVVMVICFVCAVRDSAGRKTKDRKEEIEEKQKKQLRFSGCLIPFYLLVW